MDRVLQPKRPKNTKHWKHWKHIDNHPMHDGSYAERWLHPSGLLVITNVEAPDPNIGAEYHVSVSKRGKRCTSNEARVALKAFDMEHADEDNHTIIARNYWQPVADSLADYVCPCKETEPQVKLDKGDFIFRHPPLR